MYHRPRSLKINTFEETATTKLIAENNQLKQKNSEQNAELEFVRSMHEQQIIKLKEKITILEEQVKELCNYGDVKRLIKLQAIINTTLQKNAVLKAEVVSLKAKIKKLS